MLSSSSSSSSSSKSLLLKVAWGSTFIVFLTGLQVSALKSLFHPKDLLPLMPRQVSWSILNSLHSAVDILPVFVVAASSPDNTLEWKGACFYKIRAWTVFHNKTGSEFGGGTLHIKVNQFGELTKLVCWSYGSERNLNVPETSSFWSFGEVDRMGGRDRTFTCGGYYYWSIGGKTLLDCQCSRNFFALVGLAFSLLDCYYKIGKEKANNNGPWTPDV